MSPLYMPGCARCACPHLLPAPVLYGVFVSLIALMQFVCCFARPVEVLYTRLAPAIETLGLELIGAVGIWGDGRSCVYGAAETTLHSVLYSPALLIVARPLPQPQPLPLFYWMVSDLLSYLGIFSGTLRAGPCRHTGDRAHDVSRRLSARRRAHRRIITEIRILCLLQSVGFT